MVRARTSEGVVRNETTVERISARELVVVRTFNGSASTIFDAWTKPELLKQWWAPKSLGVSLFECESDLRVGGTVRGQCRLYGRPNDRALRYPSLGRPPNNQWHISKLSGWYKSLYRSHRGPLCKKDDVQKTFHQGSLLPRFPD